MRQSLITSSSQFAELRPLWESVYSPERHSLFQTYEWNRLAAHAFRSRSALRVIAVDDDHGAAILPACNSGESTRLIGDELFDYRDVLVRGEEDVAASAVRCLAETGTGLQVTALLGDEVRERWHALGFCVEPFVNAPCVRRPDTDASAFETQHHRSARLVRKLARAGVSFHQRSGRDQSLVRAIYEQKSRQVIDGRPNLFAEVGRRDFLVCACGLGGCDVFTFETAGSLVAALVTFRDGGVRRFYTIYYDYAWAHFSPGVALLYVVTRQSLADGLDCDYMTGEQPHKMRFATSATPLFRVNASAVQLAEIASGARLVAA